MRIMTWNCRDKLSYKHQLLRSVAPHIAIIQECSQEDATSLNKGDHSIWQAKQIGPNIDKGLGILSLDPKISIKPVTPPSEWLALMKDDPGRMDVVIPFEVVAPKRLHILAVWSYNNRHRKSEMDKLRGPVLCAIDFLADWLRSAPSLIVGDFNNHPVFDKSPSGKNLFSEHLNTFESLGMRSIYHQWSHEEHGKETRNTHFWTGRNYYHIDYIFASESLRKSAQFDIMSFEAMRKLGIKSDHVPLWMDLSVPEGEIS